MKFKKNKYVKLQVQQYAKLQVQLGDKIDTVTLVNGDTLTIAFVVDINVPGFSGKVKQVAVVSLV